MWHTCTWMRKLDQTHWPGGACIKVLQAFSTRRDYSNRRLLVRTVTSRTALVIGNDTTFPWVWAGISKLATLSCHRAHDAPFRHQHEGVILRCYE